MFDDVDGEQEKEWRTTGKHAALSPPSILSLALSLSLSRVLSISVCPSVSLSLSLSVCLFNCTQTRHRCISAHLLSLSSDLSDSCDHSPNAFALAQDVPENRVALDVVAERR